jgi:hypothetical protein
LRFGRIVDPQEFQKRVVEKESAVRRALPRMPVACSFAQPELQQRGGRGRQALGADEEVIQLEGHDEPCFLSANAYNQNTSANPIANLP